MKTLKKIKFNNNKPVPNFGANLKDTVKMVEDDVYLALLRAGVDLTLMGTITEVSNATVVKPVVLERGIPEVNMTATLVHTGEIPEATPIENAAVEEPKVEELVAVVDEAIVDEAVIEEIVEEPKVETLEEKTVEELKDLAKSLNIQFKYAITKVKLIELIEKKQSAN